MRTPPTLDIDYRWYVIIKCIIIKKVIEKSQLNVGLQQHAQWQLLLHTVEILQTIHLDGGSTFYFRGFDEYVAVPCPRT